MGLLGDLMNEVSEIRKDFDGLKDLKDDVVSSVKDIATGATELTEETTQQIKDNANQLSDAAQDVKGNIIKK